MEQTYFVSSLVRSVETRLARFQAPTRNRFKQYILGGTVRLVRKRPIAISHKQLLCYHDELQRQQDVEKVLRVHVGSVEGPVFVFGQKEVKAAPKAKPAPKAEPAPEPVAEPTPEPEPETEPEVEPELEKMLEELPPPPPPPTQKRSKKK